MEVIKNIMNSSIENIVGDSHHYTYDRYTISLLYPCLATSNHFEICCIDGNLFHGCQRYYSLELAEDKIMELFKSKETQVRLEKFLK